jgi:NhaP-type Na+/H+ or K+/H+ antiporter
MGQFFLLALESVLLGLFAGILSSLLFKWFRFLCHSSITETLLIFIIAMLTYFLSEASELSGIISLLTCGITMAHYTWYNLSPQGKTISSVTVSVFGSAAEGIVFTYIGLCLFTYAGNSSVEAAKDREWSVSFILWMTLIIIVGRLMGTGISHFLFNMCSKRSDITCRELMFIMYGGMIRGAIAFGLVLKLPSDDTKFKERGVIVTTTLSVVIITVLGFGSFMPIAQKILVPAKVEDAIDQFDEPDTQEIEYDEQEFYAQIPTETGLKESLVKGNNKKDIQFKQNLNPNDTNSIDPNVSNSKAESINISDDEKDKLNSKDNSRH